MLSISFGELGIWGHASTFQNQARILRKCQMANLNLVMFLISLDRMLVFISISFVLTMTTKSNLNRRGVLKSLAYGTICSGLCSVGPMLWLVSDIQAGETAVYKMSFDEFPQLSKSYGSVRVNVAGIPGENNQIVVTRMPGNQFYAVTSKCTHRGVAVEPFQKGKGLYCRAHGSQFDVDGRVVRGPARSALKSYETSYDGGESVSVKFPNLGYVVNSSMLQAADGDRLLLSFDTIAGMEYSIVLRSRLKGEDASLVKFSTTKDGPTNSSIWTGKGGLVRLYVKPVGDVGFIQVIRE